MLPIVDMVYTKATGKEVAVPSIPYCAFRKAGNQNKIKPPYRVG
jgi:hypothetical protein